MVAISTLLLGLTTASALVIPRDGSQVLSDLKRVNADFVALAQADQQFAKDGNATAVQARVTQADLDNDLTVTDATASTPIPNGQSIIDYINGTLEPSIRAAINATVANKAQVAKAGVSGLLAAELTELKNDNDNIGAAIGAKIPKAQQAALKAAIAKIDQDYDFGISQFS